METKNTVNAGSMADVAFLLCIFFLVVTTIETDQGIMRKLPQIQKDRIEVKQKKRNTMLVLINKNDQLMVNGSPLHADQLCEEVKNFIQNETQDIQKPEFITLKDKLMDAIKENDKHKEDFLHSVIKEFDVDIQISKGIVSLQNDYSTTYEMYINVQNEIGRAFNEMREDKSMDHFGKLYCDLSKEHQEYINTIIPMQISEAEPRRMVTTE